MWSRRRITKYVTDERLSREFPLGHCRRVPMKSQRITVDKDFRCRNRKRNPIVNVLNLLRYTYKFPYSLLPWYWGWPFDIIRNSDPNFQPMNVEFFSIRNKHLHIDVQNKCLNEILINVHLVLFERKRLIFNHTYKWIIKDSWKTCILYIFSVILRFNAII